jgi:hypothetical protein
MSIQKKSLLNSLNTTKKAIVASRPAKDAVETGTHEPAKAERRMAAHKLAVRRPAVRRPAVR